MTAPVVLLSYAACGTCKKAQAWLKARGITFDVRPIVEQPPTRAELDDWIACSRLPVRKWLNTSGQSYRALGKDAVAAMSDEDVRTRLSEDGKLIKRPVLVMGETVLVGFGPEEYEGAFAKR